MSEIQSPPATYDGHVNIEEFWDTVAMDMISKGFYPSKFCFLFVSHIGLHDIVIDIVIWLSVI